MPLKYLAEMFCDRVAAGKTYLGKAYTDDQPLAYFLRGNAQHAMHPRSAATLESWLTTLAEKGESAAFTHIRVALKADKRPH
jgi:hypothetical protein